MKDLKKTLDKIQITRIGILLLCISFVFSGFMLFNSPIDKNSIITGLAQAEDTASASKGAFFYIGTASFIINVALLLLLISYHLKLKSALVVKSKDTAFVSSTPKQAIDDFFQILTKLLLKRSNINYIHSILLKIRDNTKDRILALKNIDFKKDTKNNAIIVKVKKSADWQGLSDVFNLYLTELGLNEDKFIDIAIYENKNELIKILKHLKQIRKDQKE